jgi:hypothetical protein
MPRPKPLVPTSKQFTCRITEDDDALVERLVALDAEEHRENPNRAAWFRRLIYREAIYRRVLPERPTVHGGGADREPLPFRKKAPER